MDRRDVILRVLVGELERQHESLHWGSPYVDASKPEEAVIDGRIDLVTLAMTLDLALTVNAAHDELDAKLARQQEG